MVRARLAGRGLRLSAADVVSLHRRRLGHDVAERIADALGIVGCCVTSEDVAELVRACEAEIAALRARVPGEEPDR